MGFCRVLVLIFVTAPHCDSGNVVDDDKLHMARESCTGETFQPSCPGGRDVVLLTTAIYGRMKVGRCVSQKELNTLMAKDPKYFGCSSDVLEILHKKCSLRSSCDVKIPDSDMDKTEPCFPGLKLYLYADYKCINVVDHDSNCKILATEVPKYLSSRNNTSNCGTIPRPWIIEAPRGQKVKFTLENLHKIDDHNLGIECGFEIGYVGEKLHGVRQNVTLCSSGRIKSFRQILRSDHFSSFVSAGNTIELVFNAAVSYNSAPEKFSGMMLMKVEVDGCTDIIPPEDTWLKRNNDDIVIGCYSSKQTWYLRCENRKWNGVVGNCSNGREIDTHHGQTTSENEKVAEAITEEQQIILFVAICALGLVICLTIVCIGAICIKKFSWKSGANSLYSKQPLYHQGGHYSINRQSATVIRQKSVCGHQQPYPGNNDNSLNGYPEMEKSEENKYFVLEDQMTQ